MNHFDTADYLKNYISARVKMVTEVPNKTLVTVGFVMSQSDMLAGAINFAESFKMIDPQQYGQLCSLLGTATEMMLNEARRWDYADLEFGKNAAAIALDHFKTVPREGFLSDKLARLLRQTFSQQDHLLDSTKELLKSWAE